MFSTITLCNIALTATLIETQLALVLAQLLALLRDGTLALARDRGKAVHAQLGVAQRSVDLPAVHLGVHARARGRAAVVGEPPLVAVRGRAGRGIVGDGREAGLEPLARLLGAPVHLDYLGGARRRCLVDAARHEIEAEEVARVFIVAHRRCVGCGALGMELKYDVTLVGRCMQCSLDTCGSPTFVRWRNTVAFQWIS